MLPVLDTFSPVVVKVVYSIDIFQSKNSRTMTILVRAVRISAPSSVALKKKKKKDMVGVATSL